jgi:hypothetical protein
MASKPTAKARVRLQGLTLSQLKQKNQPEGWFFIER